MPSGHPNHGPDGFWARARRLRAMRALKISRTGRLDAVRPPESRSGRILGKGQETARDARIEERGWLGVPTRYPSRPCASGRSLVPDWLWLGLPHSAIAVSPSPPPPVGDGHKVPRRGDGNGSRVGAERRPRHPFGAERRACGITHKNRRPLWHVIPCQSVFEGVE